MIFVILYSVAGQRHVYFPCCCTVIPHTLNGRFPLPQRLFVAVLFCVVFVGGMVGMCCKQAGLCLPVMPYSRHAHVTSCLPRSCPKLYSMQALLGNGKDMYLQHSTCPCPHGPYHYLTCCSASWFGKFLVPLAQVPILTFSTPVHHTSFNLPPAYYYSACQRPHPHLPHAPHATLPRLPSPTNTPTYLPTAVVHTPIPAFFCPFLPRQAGFSMGTGACMPWTPSQKPFWTVT